MRWEYCYIKPGFPDWEFVSMTPDVLKRYEVRKDKSKGDKEVWDPINRLVAQLGLDGWEMCGVGPSGDLWFKRPKE